MLPHRGLVAVSRMFARGQRGSARTTCTSTLCRCSTPPGAAWPRSARCRPAARTCCRSASTRRRCWICSSPSAAPRCSACRRCSSRMPDEQAVATRATSSSWRLSMLGGAPVAPELVRRIQDQLGVRLSIVFGQTEASPVPHPDPARRPNPEDGDPSARRSRRPRSGSSTRPPARPLPVGVVGELCARGYRSMLGYFDDPDGDGARRSTPTAGCTPATWAVDGRGGYCGCRADSRT